MRTIKLLLLALVATSGIWGATGAGILDLFKRKPAAGQTPAPPDAISALSQEQMVQGLKQALGKGVEQAVGSLSQPDGFLKDLKVKIPMPQSLQRVERTLRAVGQDRVADDFVTTMNRAAESAAPEAAAVLGDAIKQMSIADAKSILMGTNNAATQYFRQTSETNLFARFHPIVKEATAKTGVTSTYKKMMDTAKLGGGFGTSLLGKDTADIDSYVTQKALDGLFVKIAEEEKRIRENPVARTTDLLQKVFGAVKE